MPFIYPVDLSHTYIKAHSYENILHAQCLVIPLRPRQSVNARGMGWEEEERCRTMAVKGGKRSKEEREEQEWIQEKEAEGGEGRIEQGSHINTPSKEK